MKPYFVVFSFILKRSRSHWRLSDEGKKMGQILSPLILTLLFCESFENPRRIRNTRQPVYWIKQAIRTKRCCIECPKLRKGKHHGSYRSVECTHERFYRRNYALEKLDLFLNSPFERLMDNFVRRLIGGIRLFKIIRKIYSLLSMIYIFFFLIIKFQES